MKQKKITITTCNLYNLQSPGKPMYSKTTPWTNTQYNKKIGWTARALSSTQSDIIGFQELWSLQALQDIFAKRGLKEKYDLLVPPGHNDKEIVCAAAVKKGLLQGTGEWINSFPAELVLKSLDDPKYNGTIEITADTFSRPVLHFAACPHQDVEPIHLYVCHFKSKGPTKISYENWYDNSIHGDHFSAIGGALSTIRRTTEAAALRVLLTKQMKETSTPVVVMGDLNDSQQSNTLDHLTEQPKYLQGLSKGGGGTALYSVGTLQEYRSMRDVYYTYIYKDTYRQSLDHILVSEEFYDHSRNRVWSFDGMQIINDHLNDDNHKQDGSSDHGIVTASFKLNRAK